MKAALCKTFDGPAGIVIEDIAPPTAGPGQAVIAVKAATLNFFDTLITRGKYQVKPELPFSPSGEVAGVVESLG
ncbi:MAG: alcohol dehydrogenase catalytic domain-containing protein, partial [Hyphomicrobium sp.]